MNEFTNSNIEMGSKRTDLPSRQLTMNKRSFSAERFRIIKTNIKFMKNKGNPIRVVGITSSTKGEGKTFLSNNLAETYANQGEKTLLVDMDLHRPALSKLYGKTHQNKGLSNILNGECDLLSVIKETNVDNLFFLSSGFTPPTPIELLTLPSFEKLIVEMKQEFNFIIFDAPPVNILDDVRTVGSLLDGVIYLTVYNKTKEVELASGVEALKKANVNILGVAINRKKYTDKEQQLYQYY